MGMSDFSRGIRTQARPLVTRSADRVIPADCSQARFAYTSFTPSSASPSAINGSSNNNISTANNHLAGFRPADMEARTRHSAETVRRVPADSSFATGSLPLFEHAANSAVVVKTYSAFPRTGSCPGAAARSTEPLPPFDRSLSFHSGAGNRSGKKLEIPIKFLSESGHVRSSELTHRVQKSHPNGHKQQQQQQGQKTLQPSKYGFHRRSKSPTFKRLIEVAEKLHMVVVNSTDSQEVSSDANVDNSDNFAGCSMSPTGVRFPAVSGGEGDGAVGKEVGSEDERGALLGADSVSATPLQRVPKHQRGRQKVAGKHQALTKDVHVSNCLDNDNGWVDASTSTDLINGLGAWDVDSLSVDSGAGYGAMADPIRLMLMPHGQDGAGHSVDSLTELHLFLPRLADTASEESGSVRATAKASPDRHRPQIAARNSNHEYHGPPASTGTVQRGKTAAHPHTSLRPPHHPQSAAAFQGGAIGGTAGGGIGAGSERSGRPQAKRFNSPVRAGKRDRTPNKRRGGEVVYESYEPFIKGEHLKEKLDDFPTLISLDQD